MADECRRCGFCCTYAQFRVPKDGVGMDQGRWAQLHGCRLTENKTQVCIFVPIVCAALVWDEKTKQYSCGIYDTRPQICRDYACPKHNQEGETK